MRFDHVWAEAYVPSEAYRGVDEQLGSKAWLPLDPSIKENELVEPVADFAELLEPAMLDWAQYFSDNAEKVGDDGIITPPTAEMAARTQAVNDEIQDVIREHAGDDAMLGDVIGGTRIKRIEQTYLSATTPFRERSVSGELRTLPWSLNASVSITVSGADPLSSPSYDPEEPASAGFTYTARTSDLASPTCRSARATRRSSTPTTGCSTHRRTRPR